jgi:hypothetical protein
MKSAIPWICIVALLGGVYFLYSSGKTKDAEIARLHQENQDLSQVRAENDELKKTAAPSSELDRLRKDNEDLLRLRSEVSKLRDQNKQLGQQVQAEQTQRTQAQQQQQQLSQQAVESEARLAQVQQAKQAQDLASACINILRQIDGAKQMWALDNKKTPDALPTPADLAPYFPNNTFPGACPGGGAYSINAVGVMATCTVPGHVLK